MLTLPAKCWELGIVSPYSLRFKEASQCLSDPASIRRELESVSANYFFKYLFIWLLWVIVAACGI